MTPEMRQALIDVGEHRQFAAGDILRAKGAYASDLLLILEGQVDCLLSEDETRALTLGPDSVVGEIGFLTGQAANATLRAADDVRALSLDAAALATLRQGAPEIAADVLRHLAHLMRARVESNKEQMDEAPWSSTSGADIVRCSTLDQLRTAQRLRYDVQYLDHGRSSADADHDEKLIRDDFDTTGTTFLAYQGARPVGTLRVNVGQHSDFDVLTQLYGMNQSGDGAMEWAVVSLSRSAIFLTRPVLSRSSCRRVVWPSKIRRRMSHSSIVHHPSPRFSRHPGSCARRLTSCTRKTESPLR